MLSPAGKASGDDHDDTASCDHHSNQRSTRRSPLEGSGGSLEGVKAAVLAGTGPVGQRVARLMSRLGANVAIGSRSLEKKEVLPS